MSEVTEHAALADLEDLGLVWRSVVEREKFRLTADGHGAAHLPK